MVADFDDACSVAVFAREELYHVTLTRRALAARLERGDDRDEILRDVKAFAGEHSVSYEGRPFRRLLERHLRRGVDLDEPVYQD